METEFAELKTYLGEIIDLRGAAAILGWDRQTKMPAAGAPARIRQMSTLARLVHERATSSKLGDMLETLDEWAGSLDYGSDEAGIVRVTKRDYDQARRVPSSLVTEMAQARGEAYGIWEKARENNDFASFLPALERNIELARRYADCFAPYDSPYDPLIDDYETDMTRAMVAEIFDKVKGPQVELLKAIVESGVEIDDSILHQHYPHDDQLAASLEAAQIVGYDLKRGRLDLTTHPFMSSSNVNDARITTRVYENFLNPCLYGVLHETGHALYELGVAQRFDNTPLGHGTSLGVHESQSRMFENLIGRSRPFVQFFLPILQRYFPSQLNGTDVETFYRAINKVTPSLIRVEADEVTYNLHIILRFEIEVGLMEGSIAAKDLPEIWNSKMQEYLGITPPNDSQGVLQDVHWSSGLIGYFPTYALGNIISAQLWQQMAADLPDREAQIAAGNIDPLREWLIEHVHQHGRMYTPVELIERVTGGGIDVAPYIDYLTTKYSQIYRL